MCLGGFIWLVDHFLGTGLVPIMPVALLAVAMTLLPVVGVTLVWLPIAILFGRVINRAAIAVGVGNLHVHGAMNTSITVLKVIDDHVTTGWIFIVLGLVGGLLSFGLKGFIIGQWQWSWFTPGSFGCHSMVSHTSGTETSRLSARKTTAPSDRHLLPTRRHHQQSPKC